jgi:DNA-binding XRE family transcriptional regulator
MTKLEEYISERGIAQSFISRRAGIHATHLSRIVGGHIEPRISTALKIAKALRVNVEDIFTNGTGESA